jgi:aspartyl protease family protein
MRHDLLEPERGTGLMGWAVRQLLLWLGGGFAVYWLFTNYGLLRPSTTPAVKPQAEAAQPAASPQSTPLPVLGRAVQPATYSLALRARADGHVVVNGMVNGAPVRFLVDTGATTVALTPADAIRAGVAGSLNYSITVATANGLSKAAPVMLRDIRIGALQIDDISAQVMEAPGGISLLGQSFLSRLKSYQMHDGVLTMTWQQ